MKLQDYLANHTSKMAQVLTHFVTTTDQTKLDWTPDYPGSAGTRSISDQVKECIAVNRLFKGRLLGDSTAPKGPLGTEVVCTSTADALKQLQESADELAAVIRALTDEQIAADVVTHRGTMAAGDVCMLPIRNMAYHSGQMNLYQMLLGDDVFHMPA